MFLFCQLKQDKSLTCCAFDVLMSDVLVLATRTRQVLVILPCCIVAVLLLFSASVVLILLMPGYFTQSRTLAPPAWEVPG